MVIHSTISKALLLLDRGKTSEAEASLRTALRELGSVKDDANIIRAACILGELLYTEGRDEEARPFLERAASSVRDDDVLDYEIKRAAELLHALEA